MINMESKGLELFEDFIKECGNDLRKSYNEFRLYVEKNGVDEYPNFIEFSMMVFIQQTYEMIDGDMVKN